MKKFDCEEILQYVLFQIIANLMNGKEGTKSPVEVNRVAANASIIILAHCLEPAFDYLLENNLESPYFIENLKEIIAMAKKQGVMRKRTEKEINELCKT